MKFLPVGAEVFHSGGMTDARTDTDRQTDLIVTFRNIANAPKNYCMLSKKLWRKLHNEELSDLYSLPSIVRGGKIEKNEMGGACGAYGGGERCAPGSGGET